jgi:peroxiredoxin Q/BCP
MKRLFAAAALAAVALSTPAWAALATGAKAPDITAKSYEAGKEKPFSLATALKKGPVVLYFFPGAYTQGCNIEAKAFVSNIDKYKAQGAQIVGVTGGFGTSERAGPPAANLDEAVKDFSTSHCNGQFPVVVASADLITAYDVALTQRPGWSNRTSYVIGTDGKIAMAYSNLSPDGHIEKTLESVTALKAAKK